MFRKGMLLFSFLFYLHIYFGGFNNFSNFTKILLYAFDVAKKKEKVFILYLFSILIPRSEKPWIEGFEKIGIKVKI